MTKDRKMAASSLRKAVTLQTLVRSAKLKGRHQVANRFARLENERARLEREIGIWENCRQMAANKLAKVRSEIDSLRPLLLDEVPAKRAVCRKQRGQHRAPASKDAPGQSLVANRTMQLEY